MANQSRFVLFVLLVLLVPAACGIHRERGRTTLTWSPTGEHRVVGYNIYRAEEPEGEFLQINADLVRGPRYVDREVLRGKVYYYRVTAVTASGVQSVFSATASKTVE